MLLWLILRGNKWIIIVFVFFLFVTQDILNLCLFSIHSSRTFSSTHSYHFDAHPFRYASIHACMYALCLCVYIIESLLNGFRLLILVCNFPFSLKAYNLLISLCSSIMLLNNYIAFHYYNVDTPSFDITILLFLVVSVIPYSFL